VSGSRAGPSADGTWCICGVTCRADVDEDELDEAPRVIWFRLDLDWREATPQDEAILPTLRMHTCVGSFVWGLQSFIYHFTTTDAGAGGKNTRYMLLLLFALVSAN
jgi:hypothetical protein